MAARACLKNDFTADEKYYDLMSWLNFIIEDTWNTYYNYHKIWTVLFYKKQKEFKQRMYVCIPFFFFVFFLFTDVCDGISKFRFSYC